jgi:hypothetical protein
MNTRAGACGTKAKKKTIKLSFLTRLKDGVFLLL